MQPSPAHNRQPGSQARQLATLILFIWLPIVASAGDGSRNTQADVLAIGLPITALALTSLKKDRPGTWAATKSLGLTVTGTLAFNTLVHKNTPSADDDDDFPSGHSAVPFSSAAFIQRRYGWQAGLPAYAVAGYVGWLRVKTDEHDWADVLGGAALGIASSALFTQRWSEKVVFSPWIGPGGTGIAVHASW